MQFACMRTPITIKTDIYVQMCIESDCYYQEGCLTHIQLMRNHLYVYLLSPAQLMLCGLSSFILCIASQIYMQQK